MLSERGIATLSSVLSMGCNVLKLFPYTWDPIKFELRPPPWHHVVIFRFHHAFASVMALLTVYNMATIPNWEKVPDHVKLLMAVGLVAHAISGVCFLQFWITGKQIMTFVNSFWRYTIKNRTLLQLKSKNLEPDFVSACCAFGSVFLYFDIPGHSMGSLNVNHLAATFPQFILDTYLLTLQLSVLFFNWVFVFLGFAWILRELKTVGDTCAVPEHGLGIPQVVDEYGHGVTLTHYRNCQRIGHMINKSFRLYLTWFPIFLLGMIVLELVGMIKHWDLPIQEYYFFPACALRCQFESMTLLGFAGKVADESRAVLAKWRQNLVVEQGKRSTKSFEWLRVFHKSCETIVCKSGPFYPFDNSILLNSLTNSIDMTTSLLIM